MKTKMITIITCLFVLVSFGVLSQNTDNLNQTKSVIQTSQEGDLIEVSVHSAGLENNILGDSPDRNVSIYLPPGYNENLNEYYPVLVLLDWNAGTDKDWFTNDWGENLKLIMDEMISQSLIKPMIIVAPDCKNKFDGSWFTNSPLAGNWEDFVVINVVEYVDNNYRTIPCAVSRGIAGFSSGAYGALKIATKHPDVFGSVYSLSAPLDFETMLANQWKDDMQEAVKATGFPTSSTMVDNVFGMAVAFAPNSNNAPSYGDFPITNEGVKIWDIWQKWLSHDPLFMINSYKENLLKLRAIKFDCGTNDNLLQNNENYSQALTNNGIPHDFSKYEGDHGDKLFVRMRSDVLPFFSATLHGTNQMDLKMSSAQCLSNSDFLRVHCCLGGIVYIVPAGTEGAKEQIIQNQYAKKESVPFIEIKIAINDLDNGLYQAFNIAPNGFISPSKIFSVVSQPPQITILVKDLYTNEPVKNCWVDINGETYYTYSTGEISLPGCGLQVISLSCDSYCTMDTTVMVYNDVTLVLMLENMLTNNLSKRGQVTVDADNLLKKGFNIYPNPTQGYITIETPEIENLSLEIISITGKVIFNKKLKGTSHYIDLTSHSRGFYFATLKSSDFITTYKIIKQ